MLLPELSAKLTAAGLVPAGYTVMQGFLPDSPDKVIVLYESGGFPPESFLSDTQLENPTVQVVVRGVAQDYTTPRTVIEAIYQAATSWGAFVQSGTLYLSIEAQQQPFFFKRDLNQRVCHVVNFVVRKELSAS